MLCIASTFHTNSKCCVLMCLCVVYVFCVCVYTVQYVCVFVFVSLLWVDETWEFHFPRWAKHITHTHTVLFSFPRRVPTDTSILSDPWTPVYMIFSPSSSLGTNLINASALEKKARPWSWHSTSPSQLPCQPPQPPTHTPCSFSHLYLRLFCMLVTFSTERIGEGLAPSCRHPSLVPHPTLCNLDPFNYVYRVEKPVVLRLRDTSNFASQPQQRVRCHWNTPSNGHRRINVSSISGHAILVRVRETLASFLCHHICFPCGMEAK